MRKNLVKFILLGSIITSFLFILFLGFNVNAEEVENTNPEPETQEVVENTEEAKEEKINEIVDFLSKLNKDELMGIITSLKNWIIAIGVTGVIALLTALIGLIAAIAKLHNEKIRNSQLREEEKAKRVEDNNKTVETIKEEINGMKMLLLEYTNGLDDKDKKQVQSNIANVQARLLELVEKTKNEE
jgi:Na+-transporting methylmalonyl-CoA/oxaloacetate decarboxylase gamma subunit